MIFSPDVPCWNKNFIRLIEIEFNVQKLFLEGQSWIQLSPLMGKSIIKSFPQSNYVKQNTIINQRNMT